MKITDCLLNNQGEMSRIFTTTGPQTFGGIPTTTNAGEFISTTSTVSGITIPTTNIPIDPNILWGAAATAMVGATLADWQKKREEEGRRKAEAQEEKRANTEKRWGLKKQEDAVRQRWQEDARQERSNNASTARWEGLAKQEEAKQQARIDAANAARWAGLAAMEHEKEKGNLGGGKPLAIPVQKDPPPPEPKSVWETIKDWWKNLWNTSDKQPSPTPDMVRTVAANIMQTMVAQTQTAMPISTPTAMATPTITPNIKIVLADGLNLREAPSAFSQPLIYGGIPIGRSIYVDPNVEPVIADNYCWVRATYTDPTVNNEAVAWSPQFLNPLSDFIRITNQGDAISYNNAVPGWAGRHIGNDLVPMQGFNPNPPIIASANGVVTNSGNQGSGYGNYVIIEYPQASLPQSIQLLPDYSTGKSIYALYGHLRDNMSGTISQGDQVQQGEVIGNMGQSGNAGGVTHLHLELRLGDTGQDLNAANGDWYNASKLPPINPSLVFKPNDTWTGWVAQSQWDSQLDCNIGNPYIGNP